MRSGVTAEQVHAAADAIAAEGQRPTIRSVRERLGTGSPNTIQRYLAEWRESRPQVAQAAYELPAELVNAFGKELRRGAEAATAELRQELSESHAETQELAEIGEGLEKERDDAIARAEAVETERDQIAQDRDQIKHDLDRVQHERNEARELAESRGQDLAQAQNRITTLTEQLDEVKEQAGNHRKRLEEAQQQAQQSQQAAAVAESKADAQAEKAGDLKEQLSELKAELSEARKEAREAREQAAKDAEAWREQVSLEHQRNAELQSERDSLADQVTRLETERNTGAER